MDSVFYFYFNRIRLEDIYIYIQNFRINLPLNSNNLDFEI